MRPHLIECATSGRARIILTLTALFSLAIQDQGAASPVPRQLYGKSVLISGGISQNTFLDETTGKSFTVHGNGSATFYFSSLGRIFARRLVGNEYGSRTYEQVGSDPTGVQRPALATGAGKGTGVGGTASFQDIHFEGRTLIITSKAGENAANRRTVEFDHNFVTCTTSSLRGTDNGKPVRQTGWNGHILQRISSQETSKPSCLIRDGNALAQ